MFARRILLAAVAAVLFIQPAIARPAAGQSQLTPAELRQLRDLLQKAQAPAVPAPPAAALEPAAPSPPPAATAPTATSAPVAPVPAVTQNTVTTTGPVSSQTSISIGTLAGQVLTWAATAFGSLLATIFAAWGVRLFKLAGVQMTDAARDRLQAIILNGLNSGAEQVSHDLAGKGQVDVKNAVVAKAVEYAQAHGADTIKQLGLDPKSGAAVEVIKARVETLIADPGVATPAVLDPQKAAS
jgi:hypothetical protein